MSKFVFIGSGSFQFTSKVVHDLLTFPAFYDCELALVDIAPDHLEYSRRVVEKIVTAFGLEKVRITTHTDRRKALPGADGVLCTVFNGGIDIWRHEIEIPKKYGVDINIGDTRSVSGIFRALRNIPLLLNICRDIEELCPNAVFLNYTNPMAMLIKAMRTYSGIQVTGLCHSVQGTAAMLAQWAGVPYEELNYLCAGVNHQAFFLRLEHRGKDLYPILRKKIEDPEYYNKEQVRNEMFRHLGYYVTESSGHNSEYNQWFRKRPDLIEKYCTHSTGWNPGEYGYSLFNRLKKVDTWQEEIETWLREEKIGTERTQEYAANIFNAILGDGVPYRFNGNVINHGSIPNLPEDACVEVPVYADQFGISQTYVGKLPEHLAILVNTTARVESLTVEAAMRKSKELVYDAVYMDPLTSAVCSLDEIRRMCDEIFEKNTEYLGDYR